MNSRIPILIIVAILGLALPQHGHASDYSKWMRITKIGDFERKLRRSGMIAYDIQCKPLRKGADTRSARFRVKVRPNPGPKPQPWRMGANRTYDDNYPYCRKGAVKAQSVSCIPRNRAGMGLVCIIAHDYWPRKRRIRLF